jgi:pimeloyl-ACP methyl ester carboxylesterase
MTARRARAVVLLVVAAPLGLPALTARAEQATPSAESATAGPLISGTSSYVSGTYAWTDYAYDDRGPDTNSRAGGDAAYPAGMTPNNVADLIQLQLRPGAAAGTVTITAVLETLQDGTRPVIGVGLDSDEDAGTGADKLPGSWAPASPLGVDHLFVLTNHGGGSDGFVRTAPDGSWRGNGTFDVAADPDANTLSATVPFVLPIDRALRAVAAVGYAGADGRSWLDGASPVHDLAFVRGEDPVAPYLQGVSDAVVNFAAGGDPVWQDYQQSAILAADADPAGAVAAIDVAKLRSGVTELATAGRKGFHTFLYRSALDLGEGIVGSGNAAVYSGPYQPYLVWSPGGPTAELPLVLYLHGSSQTHLSAVNAGPYAPESRDPVLGLPNAFLDHFRAVVAWPLGRGPQRGYTGSSEQDVLDVHEDLVDRLDLNKDRVMLAGLSMGGIGTFRLAELYPDRWSMAYSDVGFDRTGLPQNLTALPIRFQNGAPDYLVHVTNALATRDSLAAAGTVDYRSFILHQRHHQPAVALGECIYEQSFGLDRVENPARVRYKADPRMSVRDDETGLNLVYDGAYWVGGMVPAATDAPGEVDLTSYAFGHLPEPQMTVRAPHQQNVTEGRDFCGPSEVSTRDTWDEQSKEVVSVPTEARALVRGTLTALAAVTVAADRAGVAVGTLDLTATRPMTLTLTGLAPGTRVRSAGETAVSGADGTVAVALRQGTNIVEVQRRGGR